MRKFIVFSCLVSGFVRVVFPQSNITGKVTDDFGLPLSGADIVVENTYRGSVTDVNGKYIIENLKHGTYILTVSYIGYNNKSTIIGLDSDKEVNFILTKSNVIAEEVSILSTRVNGASPATYTNVRKNEIQERNIGQDIPYILSFSPSMVTTSDAGNGIGYTSFRIRGTDLNRINVTVNGIPLNDSESHGVWWVDLPDFAGSVDNVQIQRGVGTSVNGAAGFGASLNFQTFTMNWRPYATIQSSFGSYNTLKNTLSAGTGILNGKFTLDVRLSGISSDGYIDRAFSDLKSYHVQAGYYTGKTMMKFNIFSGKEKTYQAWYGVPSHLLETNRTFNPAGMIISGTGDTSFYDNETDNYQQDHYQFLFSTEVSRELFLSAGLHYTKGKGYYEEYRQDQSLEDYRIPPVVTGNDTIFTTDLIRRKWLDNDFYGLIWSACYKEDKVEGFLGGGFNRYDGRHYGTVIWARNAGGSEIDHEWYRGTGIKTDANVYMKLNIHATKKLIVYGDIQYRFINYKIGGLHEDLRNITQENDYCFFNPKLGINYEISSNHNLFCSFAVANREPARSNFTDADTAHPIPVPETLYDYEMGYKGRFNKVHMETNVYFMSYRNQMVITGEINSVGTPIMTNVPRSYRTGLEIVGGWHPVNRVNVEGNLTVSRNKIKDFTEYVDNWDWWSDPGTQPYQFSRQLGETDLAFSPSVTAGTRIIYEIVDNLKVTLQTRYVGKQYIDNTSSEDRTLDPFLVNDLTIHYDFKTKVVENIGLSLQLNNLLNAKYESNAWIYRYWQGGEEYFMDGYFPQAGFHLFGGISLKF